MSLVKRYTTPNALGDFYGCLGMANTHANNGEFKVFKKKSVCTTYSKSYLGKTWPTGVSFDFFGVQKKPAVAINCTPSKLSDDDWDDFKGLLETMLPHGAEQVWKEFKLSTIEIAVDVKVPLDDLVCLVPKVTTLNSAYLKKGTLYLGHKYGRRSYCIYDKRRQLAQKDEIDLGHDLSRIEVTLRQTGKLLSQLGDLSRPFGSLLVLRKSALIGVQKKYPLRIELAAFTSAVLGGAVGQQAYLDLDAYSRKLLLKSLKPVALNLHAKVKDWDVWIAKQQLALESRFLGQ